MWWLGPGAEARWSSTRRLQGRGAILRSAPALRRRAASCAQPAPGARRRTPSCAQPARRRSPGRPSSGRARTARSRFARAPPRRRPQAARAAPWLSGPRLPLHIPHGPTAHTAHENKVESLKIFILFTFWDRLCPQKNKKTAPRHSTCIFCRPSCVPEIFADASAPVG